LVTLTFLASVVLLEYILGLPQGGANTPSGPRQESETSAVADSASLHKLGHALERYGKGRDPESESQPAKAPKTTA